MQYNKNSEKLIFNVRIYFYIHIDSSQPSFSGNNAMGYELIITIDPDNFNERCR